MPSIIQPTVAGMFYPDDPELLHATVQSLLHQGNPNLPTPKAIIAPHAGYSCSGITAGKAYACLENARNIVKQVVIVAPSHRVPFAGIAVPSAEGYATPLGDIPIDQPAIQRLLTLPYVEILDEAFQGQENSLETQLPFLQETLKEFVLVPMLIGDIPYSLVAEALEMLWNGPETLVIASSDLSHYHDYETAKQIDQQTLDAILQLKPDNIQYEQACGRVGMQAVISVAAKKQLSPILMDFCNSGDTIGSKDQVVGYVSVHFL